MPMTSSLIKIFKFKKSKDCDINDASLKRNDDMRFSLRTSPVPTCRSSKYAIYIGGTSWNRPSAPYSIVTAPKKTKSSRSCPGGVAVPPFRPSFKDEQRFICIDQSQTTHTRVAETKEVDASVKTSEYGSCEPSPTNASQGLICSHQDSDYDNDYAVQEFQRYEAEIRRLKRRLKDDRHHYREQIINAQNETELLRREAKKVGRTLALMQRTIDSERHKNQSLKRRLHDSEVIINELRNEITTLKKNEADRERYECYDTAGASGAVGAGEALCTLTQSSADLFNVDLNPQFSDAPDEVRNFRVTHYDTSSIVETPRSSSPLVQPMEIVKSDSCAHESIICNEDFENDPRSSVRRSYSDSELPTLIAALQTDDMSNEEMPKHVVSSSAVEPGQEILRNCNEKSNSLSGSIWSSDDESVTQELICKQLRRRGDVVRFIPPRRTIRDINFKHFGQKERSALAEFDYLHDMSTDASAIASSPDYPSCNSACIVNGSQLTDT